MLTVNTLAYSYDGYAWEGVGNSIFTQEAVGIGFYNNIWVAVGKSTNSIAYSLNGFDWTGLGVRFSNAGLCLKHNGSRWLAGGDSIGNAFAYSDDGVNWTLFFWNFIVKRISNTFFCFFLEFHSKVHLKCTFFYEVHLKCSTYLVHLKCTFFLLGI